MQLGAVRTRAKGQKGGITACWEEPRPQPRSGSALPGRAAALAQETVKIGVILPYSGPVRRCREPARRRHQALHAAAWRRGRRQEDRDHPQGHRRPGAGRRQAPGAGTGGARRRRHPRRLRADAGGAGRGRRRRRGEEAHGGDERRHLDRHREVALHRAHLADHPAGQLRLRQVGLREGRASRKPTRWSPTTAPATTPKAPSPRASPRPAATSSAPTRRRSPTPTSPPSCSASRTPTRRPSTSSSPAARSRRRSARRWPSAASTPPATKIFAQGELTHPEALESMGDAADGHHHHLPLHAGARRSAQQRVS